MSSSVVQLQPKSIGREFVRRYYTILNKSPENLHCFYDDKAIFIHDDIDSAQQKTISVVGKRAICDVMKMRRSRYQHRCTVINGIDTVATINNGLVVQVFGEIAHNAEHMRPFTQSFILAAASPLQYYVLNEIFRFGDFLPNSKRTISEAESVSEQSKATHDMNATFMMDDEPVSDDSDESAITGDSDADAIIELQTKHLKSILQEAQSKDGRLPNYRKEIESAVSCAGSAPMRQISNETAKQLFQDKCIITVGSVINPNINFDDDKPSEKKKKSTESSVKGIFEPDENNNNYDVSNETENTNAKMKETVEELPNEGDKETEETIAIAAAVVDSKPKSYAELLKLEKSRSSSISSRSSSCEARNGSFCNPKDKPLIIRNSLRRKSEKHSPTNRDQSHNDNLLQVFIGNIVQGANEEELRDIFSRFGTIKRFRIHSNKEKEWLPHYAFVTYENMDAVHRCLAKRNSLYFPENSPSAQKLNVNGDESVAIPDEERPRAAEENPVSSSQSKRRRDLKQFHKNFVISTASDVANNKIIETSATDRRITDADMPPPVIEKLPNRLTMRRVSSKA